MKTESPGLTGQRETTCNEEKESRDRSFLLGLVVVLTCLFAGFVFTGSRLV